MFAHFTAVLILQHIIESVKCSCVARLVDMFFVVGLFLVWTLETFSA